MGGATPEWSERRGVVKASHELILPAQRYRDADGDPGDRVTGTQFAAESGLRRRSYGKLDRLLYASGKGESLRTVTNKADAPTQGSMKVTTRLSAPMVDICGSGDSVAVADSAGGLSVIDTRGEPSRWAVQAIAAGDASGAAPVHSQLAWARRALLALGSDGAVRCFAVAETGEVTPAETVRAAQDAGKAEVMWSSLASSEAADACAVLADGNSAVELFVRDSGSWRAATSFTPYDGHTTAAIGWVDVPAGSETVHLLVTISSHLILRIWELTLRGSPRAALLYDLALPTDADRSRDVRIVTRPDLQCCLIYWKGERTALVGTFSLGDAGLGAEWFRQDMLDVLDFSFLPPSPDGRRTLLVVENDRVGVSPLALPRAARCKADAVPLHSLDDRIEVMPLKPPAFTSDAGSRNMTLQQPLDTLTATLAKLTEGLKSPGFKESEEVLSASPPPLHEAYEAQLNKLRADMAQASKQLEVKGELLPKDALREAAETKAAEVRDKVCEAATVFDSAARDVVAAAFLGGGGGGAAAASGDAAELAAQLRQRCPHGVTELLLAPEFQRIKEEPRRAVRRGIAEAGSTLQAEMVGGTQKVLERLLQGTLSRGEQAWALGVQAAGFLRDCHQDSAKLEAELTAERPAQQEASELSRVSFEQLLKAQRKSHEEMCAKVDAWTAELQREAPAAASAASDHLSEAEQERRWRTLLDNKEYELCVQEANIAKRLGWFCRETLLNREDVLKVIGFNETLALFYESALRLKEDSSDDQAVDWFVSVCRESTAQPSRAANDPAVYLQYAAKTLDELRADGRLPHARYTWLKEALRYFDSRVTG